MASRWKNRRKRRNPIRFVKYETGDDVKRLKLARAPPLNEPITVERSASFKFNPMAILGPERSCVVPFGALDFRNRAIEKKTEEEREITAESLRTCRELVSMSAERDFLRSLSRLYRYKGNVEGMLDIDKRVFLGLMMSTAVFNPDLTISQEGDDDVIN